MKGKPMKELLLSLLLVGGMVRADVPADALRGELESKDVVLGVSKGAVPGTVLVSSAPAVPLAFGQAGGFPVPVAAAATVGKGRIVAVGHTAFFAAEATGTDSGNRAFFAAAVRWLLRGASPKKFYLCGKPKGLFAELAAKEGRVEEVRIPGDLARLPPDALIVLHPDSFKPSDMPPVRRFLENGGSAILTVVGWGWGQLHPGKSYATDNAFNVLTAGTGLATDSRCAHPSGERGFEAKPSFDDEVVKAGAWQADPFRVWPAHPDAAKYPGLPPAGSPRVTRTVEVDTRIPRWHGTGLFAVAGEKLTVTLPSGAEALGLRLRIGATTCRNVDKKPWKRPPVVDIEVPLEKRTVSLSSPFGGMVYVVVPEKCRAETVKVTLGPACPSPRYVLGRDTPETWKRELANPAPVAELECGKIVLTVPRSRVLGLADPAPLLETWIRVLDCDAKLTGLPPERKYAERFCYDVQLCAGYMHAGYPIMIPEHSTAQLVSNDALLGFTDDNVWGLFHEMGHNHQNRDWTFDGSVEVTVNLFTLYCLDKISGKKPRETKIGSKRLAEKVAAWNARGRSFDEWKKDPFLALDFFVKLQERYGWEPFEKMFAEYRALAPSERPKTDLDKRVQWADRFSRIVGEDLHAEFAFMTGGAKASAPAPAPSATSRRFQMAGLPAPVYYDAFAPLGEGSACETAVVLIHGWGGGGSGRPRELDRSLAERTAGKGARPYVVAPLFPRLATIRKHKNEADDGRAVWNGSMEGKSLNETFDGADDWRGGGDANNAKLSSFEVIDAIFAALADKGKFPNLRRVVLAGFSAGGQFVGRYAAVGKGRVRDGVEVAYVAMAPSTELRLDEDVAWHYGLKDRPRYSAGLTKAAILANLGSRRVWRACGERDVKGAALDVRPEAMAQGANRLERFRNFQRYLDDYPEWKAQVSFKVIPGIGHDGGAALRDPDCLAFILGE